MRSFSAWWSQTDRNIELQNSASTRHLRIWTDLLAKNLPFASQHTSRCHVIRPSGVSWNRDSSLRSNTKSIHRGERRHGSNPSPHKSSSRVRLYIRGTLSGDLIPCNIPGRYSVANVGCIVSLCCLALLLGASSRVSPSRDMRHCANNFRNWRSRTRVSKTAITGPGNLRTTLPTVPITFFEVAESSKVSIEYVSACLQSTSPAFCCVICRANTSVRECQ